MNINLGESKIKEAEGHEIDANQLKDESNIVGEFERLILAIAAYKTILNDPMTEDELKEVAKEKLDQLEKYVSNLRMSLSSMNNNIDTLFIKVPHIGVKILQNLNLEDLESCKRVNKIWRELIENHKLYWERITRDVQGWKKLLFEIDSVSACSLGKSFLFLKERFADCHPIFCAIHLDDTDILKKVIDIFEEVPKVSFGSRDEDQLLSPFDFAARYGGVKTLEYFLQNGLYEENNGGGYGFTHLHFAAQGGHVKIIKLLLDTTIGDAKKENFHGDTPLHLAVSEGHLETVRLFLERMEYQNCFNQDGFYPIHIAQQKGHQEIVDLLHQTNNPNPAALRNGDTLLHIAVKNGNVEGVKKILAKVQPNEENPGDVRGITPLHIATMEGDFEMAQILLGSIHGNKNPGDFLNGWTPLHEAAKNEYGSVELFELLLRNAETDKNPADLRGKTPMHVAVEHGNVEITRLILENLTGSKNPQDNEFGDTPLHLAARQGNFNMVKLILSHLHEKIDVKNCNGETPFESACLSPRINERPSLRVDRLDMPYRTRRVYELLEQHQMEWLLKWHGQPAKESIKCKD